MLELFNGITTLLILHTLLYMVGPKKSTILACGLFAYLSVRDNHTFSWDKFNHLGLDNDERGGDSIGRVVGDQIEKFVSKKTKTTYQEYVINTKNSEPSHIALGHTRKASVGEISKETAQPVVLDLPDGSGQFIMIHNGTLHNWEELATRYGINKTGKSDSMVFAEIIMNNGYDVLLQYQGAAALIIKDDRYPDTLRVFKGKSKTYGNKVEEERPLYYYQESETSIYISSREEGLYFIGGDADTVVDFEPNKLYTIFEGQIVEQVEYDRSECSQNKVFASSNNNYGNYKRGGSYGNAYEYGYYNDWDAYEDSRASQNVTKMSIKTERIVVEANPDKIASYRLRYYFFPDGKTPMYANGPINLSEDGIKNRSVLKKGEKVYYFYRGVMLKDKAAYEACKRELGKARYWVDNEAGIEAIVKYSVYPVCTVESATPTWENAREYFPGVTTTQSRTPFFTGEVDPIFGKKLYKFKYGSLESIVYRSFPNNPTHKDPETKIISLPAVFNDNMGGISRHPVNCECKTCTEALNAAFRAELNRAQQQDYAEYENIPEGYELCPDCGGTGEEVTSTNYCVTCDGSGYIKIQDEDPVDVQMDNEILNKAVDDGLQALLLAIDKCRAEVEEIGLTTKYSKTTLDNLSKLEDLLLEVNKFKSLSILTGYEQF